jgi:hypothetical protein
MPLLLCVTMAVEGNKKGSLKEPLGLRPPLGWSGLGEVGRSLALTDSVKFVKTMDASRTGQAIPIVSAALSPTVQPSLAHGGKSERTQLAGFTINAVLVTTQKSPF